jgi:hypothetical protein
MQRELTIRAFLREYKAGQLIFAFLDDEREPFTKKFLTECFRAQNSPVIPGGFKVKNVASSKAYRDKACLHQIPTMDLVNNVVEARVVMKHYSFTNKGKKIFGWNLTLIDMSPL